MSDEKPKKPKRPLAAGGADDITRQLLEDLFGTNSPALQRAPALGRSNNADRTPPPSIGLVQEKNKRDNQEDHAYAAEIAKITASQARAFLEKAVAKMDMETISVSELSKHMQGSTFTGAVVTHDAQVVTAHLGVSPAALILIDPKTHTVETKLLTEPHLPAVERTVIHEDNEKTIYDQNRIRHYEGKIDEKHAVLPMTHALGDTDFYDFELDKHYISKKPDIAEYDIKPYLQEGKKAYLLVASGGAIRWKKPDGDRGIKQSLDNVAGLLNGIVKEHAGYTPDQMAKALLSELMQHGHGGDNITLALTEIEPGKSKVIGVLDGHMGKEVSAAGRDAFAEEVETRLTRSGPARA